MAARASILSREIAEIPAVAARQIADGLDGYREVGERLRRLAPRFIVTCARGSSDHAATYLKYVVETRIGIPVASMGPSVASVYAAPLVLDGAACITISQSGRSPDLACFQGRARAGGAETFAITNMPDSPVGAGARVLVPMLAGPGDRGRRIQVFRRRPGRGGRDRRRMDRGRGASRGACRHPGLAARGARVLLGRRAPRARRRRLALRGRPRPGARGRRGRRRSNSRKPAACTPRRTARQRCTTVPSRSPAVTPRDRFAALVFHARDRSRRSLDSACEALRASGAPVFTADFDAGTRSRLPVVAAGHPLLDPPHSDHELLSLRGDAVGGARGRPRPSGAS